jgi:hypothetical protein
MNWGILAEIVLGGIGSMLLLLLKIAVDELKAMRVSVVELNEKVAVVISRLDSHENRITRLEDH